MATNEGGVGSEGGTIDEGVFGFDEVEGEGDGGSAGGLEGAVCAGGEGAVRLVGDEAVIPLGPGGEVEVDGPDLGWGGCGGRGSGNCPHS